MRVGRSLRWLLDSKLSQPGGLPARAVALGIAVLAIFASLTPNISVPNSAPAHTDLLIHILMQGILGFSLIWGWPKNLLLTFVILTVLVLTLEIGQIWVPGRSFSAADLVSNMIGASLGAGFSRFLVSRRSS